jgi:transcriptional regulator with XRE-family HTH domain
MAKAKKAPPARQKPRSSGPLDAALGEKIRARRLTAKMTQEELANQLGVSFQQVQKYEKGVNRVSAVRLEQIAKALGENIAYFQEEGGTISKAGREMQALMTDPLNLRACKALSAIDNQAIRFQWVRLMEAFSCIHTNDD